MLTAWNAVSTLDRMLDDVMGTAFGTATSSRAFDPAIDVRASENETGGGRRAKELEEVADE